VLAPLENDPRDYAWGSVTRIAGLQGREPTGRPEAEVWFGDHPGAPARLGDGRRLDVRLRERNEPPLPYLLKLLAAAAPLSIQAHPTKAQAEAGFAAEDRAGIPRDAAERNYRDANHKPEIVVALGGPFEALAGLRDLDATRTLLAALPQTAAVAALTDRLAGDDAAAALRGTLAWLLSGEAQAEVDGVIAAVSTADASAAAPEFAAVRRIAAQYPGDPGVVVALLMNLVRLEEGEALYAPAGVLHAYLDGLGVELMAASDNVLRGGLTPKHIDVEELLRVVDTTPSAPPRIAPVPVASGVEVFRPDVPDFELWRVDVEDAARTVPLHGPAIVLAVAGEVHVGSGSGAGIDLAPGGAAFATTDEGALTVSGHGRAYIALPGH